MLDEEYGSQEHEPYITIIAVNSNDQIDFSIGSEHINIFSLFKRSITVVL